MTHKRNGDNEDASLEIASETHTMLTKQEVEATRKRNYRQIRELIRMSFTLGVNLTTPTVFKDSLRIITVGLIVSATLSLYGNWSLFMRYKNNIFDVAETILTAIQAIISIIKLIYYLFTQRRFYRMLRQAQTHEILQKLEIFHNDFPGQQRLKLEIDAIMNAIWKDVRRQLLFYTYCCVAIISNYFFEAIFINLYHQIKATPNYKPKLPFPAVFPMWEDKGMAFPYYHIQIYLTGSADFIAGICAISFDGVFIVICSHAVGLVKVLNLIVLRSTSPMIPKERRVEYLRYCIYHYQRVYSFFLDLQRIYLHISLTQFVLSLMVYGLVLFELNVGYESDIVTLIRMVMYFMAAGFEIIIYCYNGQRLTTASEETSLALYSCAWYDESPEFKRLLCMMIMRTNRVFYMQVSWFTLMNLPTLIALFRMSGSYFLLLRNLSG